MKVWSVLTNNNMEKIEVRIQINQVGKIEANRTIATREKVDCPFCEGSGCCFCDYEGRIFVGENELIKSKDALNSIGVKYLKETDPDEPWLELWEHFLDEKNVPEDFKQKHNGSL